MRRRVGSTPMQPFGSRARTRGGGGGGLNPDETVGLQRGDAGVEFALTDERHDGDMLVSREGYDLWVESGLEGIVDVIEPHDRLILRAPGDPERSVRAH